MRGTTVRKLQLKDMNETRKIDELTQRIYQKEKWDMLIEEEKENSLITRKSEFKVNCKTGYSFVALRDNKVIGFLFAHENLPFKTKIYVRHIAIHPKFQKQGIGKMLYVVLIEKAKLTGKKEIESLINPDNRPSIKLHEQVGFKVSNWKRAIFGI